MQLSKNFQLSEFTNGSVTPQMQVNLILLARQLQALRDYLGTSVKIVLGISSASPEHASGKAAIFTVSGKSGDQVKTAIEALISNSAIYNGTVGLLNNNQVYYSLFPNNQRWDKRGSATTGGGSSTPQNNGTPVLTQAEKTNKALITTAMVLGLIVVGAVVFKRKKIINPRNYERSNKTI